MTAPRFTKPAVRGLADPTADRVSTEQQVAISELQARVGKVHAQARFYLGRKIFTTTARYEATPGTKAILLRMVGGGGGGGGTTGGASFAMAGGGWSGVYWEKWITSPGAIVGGPITIGAGGTAGAAGAQGGTGGDTIATINGVTYTAKGGVGGLAMANGAGAAVTGIPATTGGSTSGANVNVQDAGEQGMRIAAGAGWAGSGGSTPLGSGGTTTATGNGGAANVGYGGGGAGSISGPNDQTGGAGGAGCVVIEEYA